MTDELIDLEYAHMDLDRKLKGGKEEFEDDSYDEWDKETADSDAVSSYEYEAGKAASEDAKPDATEPDNSSDEEDWEDVETDDLDP